MQHYIRNIKQAIATNTNLEKTVEQAANSINTSNDLDKLLDFLLEEANKSSRYVYVFDLLHQKFPGNPHILFTKAVSCHSLNRRESLRALTETLAILHNSDENPFLIRLCYETIGVHYQNLNQINQAIAAYTIALSYYNPDEDDFIEVHSHSLYHRARLYFQLGKPAPANKDIAYYLQHDPNNEVFIQLQKEIQQELYKK